GDTHSKLVRVQGRMAGHGQTLAVARIERDDGPGTIAERLLGYLLQIVVNAELNLFAGDGFLSGEVRDFLADAIYNDASLAVGALQNVVVLLLEAEFAGKEIGRAHSELQSLAYLVCRLLLEKKKKNNKSLGITS